MISVFGVEPFRVGGTEMFARELSSQLGARGWKSVVCFLSEPAAEVRSFLETANVKIEVIERSTESTPRSLRCLGRIVRAYRPEILHLHFTGFVGLYPWLAKLLSVKQVYFTDHSSRPAGYLPARAPVWKRGLVRLINHPITKVICVSQYGYRCMSTLDLLPRDRYELIYNGVDLSRVASDPGRGATFRRRYSIAEDCILVLQVSWIIPEKGIPALLATARLVIANDPTVRFVVVGEGPFRQQYMRTAREMGLSERVIWTGLLEDPFGQGAFDAADIVCQLSSWEEVFGWMIAEGMAYGKPVVASRVGGIPELVADEVSGFLVERGDSETAAKRILELVGDSDLREQMGRAGSEIAAQRFSLRKNVAELIETYGA